MAEHQLPDTVTLDEAEEQRARHVPFGQVATTLGVF